MYTIKNNIYGLYISLTIFLLFFSNTLYANDGMGQFNTRANYPPFLLFLSIPNDAGSNIAKGKLYAASDLSHSNTFSGEDTEYGSVLFDMEITRLSNRFIYAIRDDISIGLELPFLYMWGGFLDSTVQGFHAFFGFSNQNRELYPNNSFNYVIDNSKTIINNTKNSSGLGDISLFARYELWKKKNITLAIIPALQFPTGGSGNMTGSGRYDLGGALFFKYNMSSLIFHTMTSVIYPTHHKYLKDINLSTFITESLAIEYLFKENLSLLAQIDATTNPFTSGINKLDDESAELVLGGKMTVFKDKILSISFTENLTSETSADFAFNIGISTVF